MEPFSTTTIILEGIGHFLIIILYLVLLWIFGRMGDNINKIRKMLEEELNNRKTN